MPKRKQVNEPLEAARKKIHDLMLKPVRPGFPDGISAVAFVYQDLGNREQKAAAKEFIRLTNIEFEKKRLAKKAADYILTQSDPTILH